MPQNTRTIQPPQPAPEKASSKYINRDLSWLRFNDRVLDQAQRPSRKLFERLKFIAISAGNLDEFLMTRLGMLYKYLDHTAKHQDRRALQTIALRDQLLTEVQAFVQKQHNYYVHALLPSLAAKGYNFIKDPAHLSPLARKHLTEYFQQTLYPSLTHMTWDSYHTLPMPEGGALVFGIVTANHQKLSFIHLPSKLSRFYRHKHSNSISFIPIEEIVRISLDSLFKNESIRSVTLFRIIRKEDFSEKANHDTEKSILAATQRQLAKRKTGRVVCLEVEAGYDSQMLNILKKQWDIGQENILVIPKQSLLDLGRLKEIVQHKDFDHEHPVKPTATTPLTYPSQSSEDIFGILKKQDLLLHHPYNSIELVISTLAQAAEDPCVREIKITLYRIPKSSTIVDILCKAAQKGKRVLVVIELRARLAEEQNMRAAHKLAKAGCAVIHGINQVKTHAKLFMIVRQEKEQIRHYIHLSSGNYNEETAQIYSDVSLMTTNEAYVQDVIQFFNFLVDDSSPTPYQNLLTAPLNIRDQLGAMIKQEIHNKQQGLPAGIVIKINALEDKTIIDKLYQASQAGVPIHLIVRSMCCLIPGKPGLSEKITVRSIVGNFLEHARIYYFHNQAHPKIYVGSIDTMARSFDKRIELLFAIHDPALKQQVTSILAYNLRDNVNAYRMQTDGTYVQQEPGTDPPFDIHQAFYDVTWTEVSNAKLFP